MAAMVEEQPVTLADSSACVDELIRRVGKRITLGLPLGLGKPIRFANALYQRAKDDPSIELHIVTALSLTAPGGSSSLEKRFMGPFAERLYGRIPELDYARDVIGQRLPENVRVSEFFFKAGSFLNNKDQQRNYVCTNYTHAVRDLMALGVNVVGQMVAPATEPDQEGYVSLSCNPDLSLDLLPLLRAREAAGTPVALVAETNSHLPFLGNDAAVETGQFDIVLEHAASDYPCFRHHKCRSARRITLSGSTPVRCSGMEGPCRWGLARWARRWFTARFCGIVTTSIGRRCLIT